MRLVEKRGPTKIDYPNSAAFGRPIGVPLWGILYQFFFLKQDVFWFEVGVRVSESVHEGYGFEYLSKEWLDDLDGKAAIVIFFDELIKGGSQGVEYQAEVAIMVKGMLISNDTLFILLIASVDVFQDFFFNTGWLDVFGHRSYDLRHEYSTLIAYRLPFFSP